MLGLEEEDEDDEPELNAEAFQENSSVYHIHKVLSNDAYTIGKGVTDFINNFHS